MEVPFGRAEAAGQANPPGIKAEGGREAARPQSRVATLPGKTSKERAWRPYRKRTHVDGKSILRRSGDWLSRNSANWPRNFGRRGAPARGPQGNGSGDCLAKTQVSAKSNTTYRG